MPEGLVAYVEKGGGLHEAVADAGHFLRQEFPNGDWIGGGPQGPAFVQNLIDTYQSPRNPRWLSSAEFIRRIPVSIWDAINLARLTNMPLQRLKDMLMTGDPVNPGSINLDAEELLQGLDYLISRGLLTPEQKAALLT
jgi:hypothetical protein